MTNLEFCLVRRKAERPAFVRVLKAIPKGRLDYRPDPKARTALGLAWLFAVEEAALVSLVKDGLVEWKDSKPPEKTTTAPPAAPMPPPDPPFARRTSAA